MPKGAQKGQSMPKVVHAMPKVQVVMPKAHVMPKVQVVMPKAQAMPKVQVMHTMKQKVQVMHTVQQKVQVIHTVQQKVQVIHTVHPQQNKAASECDAKGFAQKVNHIPWPLAVGTTKGKHHNSSFASCLCPQHDVLVLKYSLQYISDESIEIEITLCTSGEYCCITLEIQQPMLYFSCRIPRNKGILYIRYHAQ